jgi:hypothetical protein
MCVWLQHCSAVSVKCAVRNVLQLHLDCLLRKKHKEQEPSRVPELSLSPPQRSSASRELIFVRTGSFGARILRVEARPRYLNLGFRSLIELRRDTLASGPSIIDHRR